jgi:arylsulfatase A-like enzyme
MERVRPATAGGTAAPAGRRGRRPGRALAAAAGLLLLAAGCRGREPRAFRGPVVLVTIDTLRADHLGCYGYPRDTTPFLDELAARGILFERAFSASSHTGPSHASLFTSLQPAQHRLLVNGQPLDPRLYTLAAMFRDAGYATAGFASVAFLGEVRHGFDHFDAARRPGDQTVERALAWLDAGPGEGGGPARPFFLWAHLYDPHGARAPRPGLEADLAELEAWPEAERDRFLAYLVARGVPADFYPDRDRLLRRYGFYDSGIRFADRQVRRLHERVTALRPDARWVVTSDHGEGMGNHRYDDHGQFLYDEQLRVPLILAGVGGEPRRIDRLVRLVDVYPTLAGWIGGRPGPGVQGHPLLDPPGAARDLPARLAFAERRPKDGTARLRSWEGGVVVALRSADRKYIFHSEGSDEFFDLRRDPLELRNLIEEPSPERDAMRERLRTYLASLAGGPAAAVDVEAGEHAEELKSLGYL